MEKCYLPGVRQGGGGERKVQSDYKGWHVGLSNVTLFCMKRNKIFDLGQFSFAFK